MQKRLNIHCGLALITALLTSFVAGRAQSVPPAASDVTASPTQASLRPAEAPLEGLLRLDKNTLALTLAKQKLLLYDFEFNGDTVPTEKLHLKLLAPGVFEVASIAYTVGEWRVRIRDAANFYGLGERSDTLNHARTVVHNLSQSDFDPRGAKGSGTSKPIPFFMSTTGYGVWFDTTGDATFDMNATSRTEIVVDCDAEKLRMVLFTGPGFAKILDSFTAQAAGPDKPRSVLPPYWAFAPWLGRHFERDAQLDETLDKARSLSLPGAVVVTETTAPGAAAVKHLHDAAYKLLVAAAPSMSSKSSSYAEAAASGFFVKSSDGAPYVEQSENGTDALIDFTNARAKLWWQDRAREAIHAGADGFEGNGLGANFAADVKFNDESDPRVMRNRYAVLYNNAMEELIQKDLKGNGVLAIRAATAGANGVGFLVDGDTESSFSPENGLPTVVIAGLNAGLSGMPLWSADPGGYFKSSDGPDPQLFMRWTEYSAFSPVMETLSNSNLLPWDYGEEALAVYRKFSTLHMSLFPYRYAAAQQAVKTGMPIMRALVLDYQGDEQARIERNEYLFGPDLLVAPIIDEGTQRTVYLPRGEWLDYWTGKPTTGGRTIVADAAIDSIPLYVKQGAVLPKIPEDIMTLVPSADSGNKTLKTMDDRRVYELYGSGDATMSDFEGRTLVRTANALKITGDSAAHIILRWRFQKIVAAMVDGRPAKMQSDAAGVFLEFDHVGQSEVRWQ